MGGANAGSRHACIFVPVGPGLVAHVTGSNARARRVDVTARIDAWNMLISCVVLRHGAAPVGMIMGGRRVVIRVLRLPRLAVRTEYRVTMNTVSSLAAQWLRRMSRVRTAKTGVTLSGRRVLLSPLPTASETLITTVPLVMGLTPARRNGCLRTATTSPNAGPCAIATTNQMRMELGTLRREVPPRQGRTSTPT
jgi:hypothetical protein